jgi:release factor glutamine methyltransferase
MVTIAQALARATSGATPVDETAESLRFEAELLLMNALGYSRASLLTWPEREVAPSALASFEQALSRRLAGEPIAYILGTKEFWDFELVVSPAVLIPRPETELLVESALEIVAHREGIQHLLDLGTGSGAVAIALARAAERIRVIGTDLSCDALTLARENGGRLAGDNLGFVQGSWLCHELCAAIAEYWKADAAGLVDVIVSNPPYIAPEDPHLSRGDLVHEPALALSCDDAGLAAIKTIVSESKRVLKRGGWLLFEHGFDQRDAVADLLRAAGFDSIECLQDIAGQDRVTRGRLS